jgi:hypothetical protein
MPDLNCYVIPTGTFERDKFVAWHAEEKKKFMPYTARAWNFWEQAKIYNHTDVEILRRAARVYRDSAMKSSTIDCDPLRYVTTPAACLALFRGLDMLPESIPNFTIGANRLLREAMHGGRTETTQFYWPMPGTPATEKLFKIDINSLYPFVEAKYPYPVGYPAKLYGLPGRDRQWPKDLIPQAMLPDPEMGGELRLQVVDIEPVPEPDEQKETELLLDILLDDKAFSFLVVDVEPPTDLLVPVLCHKHQGKLKFTLEPMQNYAVYSPLLRLARQKGYRVSRLHGAAYWDEDHVKQPHEGIFKTYVARELREKDESDGWPAECKTEEDKKAYCERYANHPINKLLGVELRPEKVEKNPGRRQVAKLRLNNLWGKMTQKEIYSSTKLFHGDEVEEFFMFKARRDIRRTRIIFFEGMVQVAYRPEVRDKSKEDEANPAEFDEDGDRIDVSRHPRPTASPHAIIPGALVPMYGQIEMYQYMDRLAELRCYMDTDSLLYRYDSANPAHEHRQPPASCQGPFLGQFKDELQEEGKQKVIKFYASGGPKNYAAVNQDEDERKGTSVVKGIKRGKLHAGFQVMWCKAKVIQRCLALSDVKGPDHHHVRFDQFLRIHAEQHVRTQVGERRYDLVNDKVELFADGSTLPIGHRDVGARRDAEKEKRQYWLKELKETLKIVEQKRDEQDKWDGQPVGTSRAEAAKRRRVEDQKDEKQREAQRARLEQEGDRLRREDERDALMIYDFDDAALDDFHMAHEPHPDPVMFDGMMEE